MRTTKNSAVRSVRTAKQMNWYLAIEMTSIYLRSSMVVLMKFVLKGGLICI